MHILLNFMFNSKTSITKSIGEREPDSMISDAYEKDVIEKFVHWK